MSKLPIQSRGPRLLIAVLVAVLALDAVVLTAAAQLPVVREQARQFVPVLGSLVRATAAGAVAHLPFAKPSVRTIRYASLSTLSAPTAPIAAVAVFADAESPECMLACESGTSVADFSYAYRSSSRDKHGFSFLVAEPSKDGDGWHMNGSFDYDRVEALKNEAGNRAFLWFSEEGSEYVVRDPALIAKALEITRPTSELGREMGRIGAEQGRIGAKQGSLGGKQGVLGARMGALAARTAAASMSGDKQRSERLQAEMEELQEQLEKETRELQAEMRPLAAEQARLGRIQSELSRKQQIAQVKVDLGMRELLERAKREGKAVRLHAEA